MLEKRKKLKSDSSRYLMPVFLITVLTGVVSCADTTFQVKNRLSESPGVAVWYSGLAEDNYSSSKAIDQFAIDRFTKVVQQHFQSEFPNVKFVYYKPSKKQQASSLSSGLSALSNAAAMSSAVRSGNVNAMNASMQPSAPPRSVSPRSYDLSDQPGDISLDYMINYSIHEFQHSTKLNEIGNPSSCKRYNLKSHLRFLDKKTNRPVGKSFYSIEPEGDDVHGLGKTYCEDSKYWGKNPDGSFKIDEDGMLKELYDEYESKLKPALKKNTDQIKNAVEKK